MEEAIKYKNVIREYFLEYKNRDQVLKSIFYVILFGASFLPFVFGSAKEGLGYIYGSYFRWLLRCLQQSHIRVPCRRCCIWFPDRKSCARNISGEC